MYGGQFKIAAMSTHLKKLVGTLGILAWLVVYCLIAMGIGVRVLPQAGDLIRLLYYVLAGTIWIVPVGLLLPWMYREPR
jgi:hypothetical protein